MKKFYYFSESKQQFVEIVSFYKKFMFLISFFGVLLSFFVFGTFLIFNEFISKNNYISKAILHENIIKAINNGADLRSVKQVYINRESQPLSYLSFSKSENNYYSIDVPLSIVLEDVRANLYLKDKSPDSLIVNKLDNIIGEHSQVNPFDKLNNLQKESFQNIRQKLGGSFPSINSELNRITDELYNKNILVEEYLKDSRTSFWVSICGLFISIIIGLYQIYLSKYSKTMTMQLNTIEDKGKLENI